MKPGAEFISLLCRPLGFDMPVAWAYYAVRPEVGPRLTAIRGNTGSGTPGISGVPGNNLGCVGGAEIPRSQLDHMCTGSACTYVLIRAFYKHCLPIFAHALICAGSACTNTFIRAPRLLPGNKPGTVGTGKLQGSRGSTFVQAVPHRCAHSAILASIACTDSPPRLICAGSACTNELIRALREFPGSREKHRGRSGPRDIRGSRGGLFVQALPAQMHSVGHFSRHCLHRFAHAPFCAGSACTNELARIPR